MIESIMYKHYTGMKKDTGIVEALTDEVTDVIVKFAMWRLYPTSI